MYRKATRSRQSRKQDCPALRGGRGGGGALVLGTTKVTEETQPRWRFYMRGKDKHSNSPLLQLSSSFNASHWPKQMKEVTLEMGHSLKGLSFLYKKQDKGEKETEWHSHSSISFIPESSSCYRIWVNFLSL